MPRTEDAPEAMLTIDPPPRSSMPGRNARMVRCMDLTLRSNEKSQSRSEHSSTVPWWTKPAALTSASMGPVSRASASTSCVESTSRGRRSAPLRPSSFAGSRSVAQTAAPSRRKVSAMARPIPCPAAVTTAVLPCNRSPIAPSLTLVEAIMDRAGPNSSSPVERRPLSSGGVEVRRVEPALERLFARRPFAVEHRKPSRVAISAFDDHVLAEHALRGESEAQRRALRGLVAVVALPLEAAVAESVEDVARQEVDRLGRPARAGEARAELDVPDLDHIVRRIDPHEREPALGAAGGGVDRGEEQRIVGRGRLGETALERCPTRERPLPQVAPQPLGLGAGAHREQSVPVPAWVEGFEADGTAFKCAALGAGARDPG